MIYNLLNSLGLCLQACASDQCNKKVVDLDNGQYRCEKCNLTSNDFKYRLLLNVSFCTGRRCSCVLSTNPVIATFFKTSSVVNLDVKRLVFCTLVFPMFCSCMSRMNMIAPGSRAFKSRGRF